MTFIGNQDGRSVSELLEAIYDPRYDVRTPALIAALDPRRTPVFRVLDAVTREASLRPVRSGVVLFNLPDTRIVQIENTYEPLAPSGELHYHNGRFLSRKVVGYRLPASWSIVP